VLVCAFDREDAVFARLTTSGHEMLATLHGDVAKKRESSTTNKNFFEEIIKQAKEYVQRYEAERIIFASPAFWKDELLKSLHDPEVKKKTILATISSADERGVFEALKEMALVEQVLSGIAKGSAIAYGFKEVRDAGSAGAVSTVLVTDGLVMRMREQGTGAELDALLASIEQQHGAVIIVSSAHDGGKKLDGLGGVAALLRYRLNV
jgi:protein pelota